MLKQRILTAVVGLSVLSLILFFLQPVIARFSFALLILVGSWEWAGFCFRPKNAIRLVYVALVAVCMAILYTKLPDRQLLGVMFKVALGWWGLAMVWLFFFPTPIPRLVSWVCGMLVLIPTWVALDYLYVESISYLVFALLIVWVADSSAYFVGRRFGHFKLAPKISPGKTWEGAFGAITVVFILSLIGSQFLTVEMKGLVLLCLAATILSIIGDLTVSMFKRDASLKDSGSFFPGHGGVLDRIDSISATAPLIALALLSFGV